MNIEKLFFELLQIAIGTRNALTVKPTSEEWALLFEMAKKQALVAIAFAGVTKLNTASDYGASLGIPEMVYLKWLGLVAKTQQRNRELNEACASLCKDLAHEGLYACILKGQSNLVNYPEELRDCRTPGDIDVWCGLMDPEGIDIAVVDLDGKGAHYEKYQGERGVIEWVLADWRLKFAQKGQTPLCKNGLPEVQYHHIDWEYKGIECEVHFRPSWMNCPWHNRRLQMWCKEKTPLTSTSTSYFDSAQHKSAQRLHRGETFNVPTIGFNAVYQLVHIYRHLFNEGIGLRQLLDYYFVLRALHIEQGELSDRTDKMQQWANAMGMSVPSNEEILRTLGCFGMKEFAGAVMWVLAQVFEPNDNDNHSLNHKPSTINPQPWMLCAPDEKRGRFLLNEIMLAGNFGKYDSRSIISANEGYIKRFIRRQKRFFRFLTQYPSEVIWGPYFSVKQRLWRIWHGWR